MMLQQTGQDETHSLISEEIVDSSENEKSRSVSPTAIEKGKASVIGHSKVLTVQEEDLLKVLYARYQEISVRLNELVNQQYGIREIERLNHNILASRSQKIQVGFLIRMIKMQEYFKISDDMKEIEALKKMTTFF